MISKRALAECAKSKLGRGNLERGFVSPQAVLSPLTSTPAHIDSCSPSGTSVLWLHVTQTGERGQSRAEEKASKRVVPRFQNRKVVGVSPQQ